MPSARCRRRWSSRRWPRWPTIPSPRRLCPMSIRQAAMEHNGQFFASLLERRPQRWSERWVLAGGDPGGHPPGPRAGRAAAQAVAAQGRQRRGGRARTRCSATPPSWSARSTRSPTLSRTATCATARWTRRANRREQDRLSVLYRPLEVAEPLSRGLFGAWPRIISTSATLSVADDLGWFRRQVGAPDWWTGAGPPHRQPLQLPRAGADLRAAWGRAGLRGRGRKSISSG